MKPDCRPTVRFGPFEADLATGELRKSGIRIKIQDLPMRLLAVLLERPSDLVTREELQQRLWPDVQSLDFEHGLNVAVKKLRLALNDSADAPRYIETLPRKGYRFIALIETQRPPEAPPGPIAKSAAPVAGRSQTGRGRLVAGGAIGAVLLATCAATILRTGGGMPPKVTILFSGAGYMNELCLSPDGKVLAFTASNTAKEGARIFLKAPGIAPPRRLTDDADPAHVEHQPRWVPGGGISYVRRENSGHPTLFLVPETGGTPRKLIEVGGNQGLSWAPDGKSLAIAKYSPSGRTAIYSLRVADGELRQLSQPPQVLPNSGTGPGGDTLPQYSPDGRSIAFVRILTDVKALMAMPASGGPPREVVREEKGFSSYAWTGDGHEIVYAPVPDSAAQTIYRVLLPNGRPLPLPYVSPGHIDAISVSRNNVRLVYSTTNARSKIWRYELPGGKESPAAPKPVAESEGGQAGPAFAPDGRHFAFTSNRSGNWEIYVSDNEGRFPVQLTSFGKGETGWPRWSPDGRTIAFDARPNGRAGIYVTDAEGGSPKLITEGQTGAVMPEWSADGKVIFYTALAGDGSTDIWKMPASGGPSTRVTTTGVYGALPSLDGEWLFASKRSSPNLEAIPLLGGTAYILQGAVHGRLAVARSGIYFVSQAAGGAAAALMHYRFAAKKTEQVMVFQGLPMGPVLAISPDEKYALFSQQDDYQSKIMLVENFR